MREVFNLEPEQVPTSWYNILADLPVEVPPSRPAPPRNNGQAPLRPQLPLSMYRPSIGRKRFVPIPEPVRAEYQRWRPTPLYRASRLEKALDTPRTSTSSTRARARRAATR
ncbi:hypothetical protein [Actinomadura sp. J1-007]|uniref:hypothetical protein n=1 Tax=Actinomadura sp. J1-007 TaxID=2661913 RepID=UPI001F501621|nr:hypothetical protein [Actinomadura sp. J1-007]